MNNDLFQQARGAYVSQQYDAALGLFTECLQDTSVELLPGEMGLLYHQIGNCLVKLQDPTEAIHAYAQAGLDPNYDGAPAVDYNLGMVYASQNDYEHASEYFTRAIDNPAYPTPYKAYLGLGVALLKLGKLAEAGAAFRSAALDETNPDPVKALINLGVCFMALSRPADAIASYESALQFEMRPSLRNKLYANMGQAYVADGKMGKAVRAFEAALADKTYVFNDAANVDYQRAVAAVASGTDDEGREEPVHQADLSGLDVSGDGVLYEDVNAVASEKTTVMAPVAAMDDSVYFHPMDGQDPTDFTDWEHAPKIKRPRRGLKVFLIIVIILALLAGGGFFAITQGFGVPSVDGATEELFADPNADIYATDVDDAKKKRLAGMIAGDTAVTILGKDVDLAQAHVYVEIDSGSGAATPYDVTLVREGIGWRVENLALYFTSQQDPELMGDAAADSGEGTSEGEDAASTEGADAGAANGATGTQQQ